MDSDDREPIENQSIGDAHMIKMIPQEDTAVANGTVLSISLSDGKVTAALFAFLKIFTNIYLECYEDGFQFIGQLPSKQSKGYETNNDQKNYDMISYLTFRKDKVPEYFFCPSNLKIEVPGSKKSLTFMLSMNQITTMLKKTKMKATTILRFDFNGYSNAFAMYVVNGVSIIPYTLQATISERVKDIIPSMISDVKLVPNYKFSVELFYTMINAAAAKSDNVAYDFRIAIHKGGVAVQTDAPGIGPIPYGTMRDNPYVFKLSHESTRYFGLIHKITPRATVLLTATDDTIFKVSFPIGSCGEGFIFQFPKQSTVSLDYQSQYSQIGYGNNVNVQQPGWQLPQIGYGTNVPVVNGWQQPQITNAVQQPNVEQTNQTQKYQQPIQIQQAPAWQQPAVLNVGTYNPLSNIQSNKNTQQVNTWPATSF